MDKLKLHSKNITDENIAKLAELFPNCLTESRNDAGELKPSIDFDLLKQELSDHLVEGPQERYQLNWPGKKEALLAANAPIAKTLRPCREESKDFDTTENLFIEGDNLEALKLLQENYMGKVKMIYIDPPYNTGKDFIYSDNFAESTEDYLLESEQVDEEGNKLIANTESNGRFHSDWLSMMYSRLRLARNLLDEDGVIFISIDENEISNLKSICDEIFGENNFLVNFSWRTDGNFDNQAKFKKCHEYILTYAKSEPCFQPPPVIDPNVPKTSKLYKEEVRNTIIKNGPKNPISTITLPRGFPADIDAGEIDQQDKTWPHYKNKAVIENGLLCNEVVLESGWSSKDLLNSFISNKCNPVLDIKGQQSRFIISKTGAVEVIKKRSETQSHVISSLQNMGGPQKAVSEIQKIDVVFDDYPKPVKLLEYLCQMVNSKDGLVVDFFAGSSSSAHAIMQLNAEDSGKRKFIMVQIPEDCDAKTEAFKAGYKNIAEISKERIRRAGEKIREENPEAKDLDVGFRVLKVADSNMKDIYYSPDQLVQQDLFDHADNVKEDRTSEDLLFQVLLDWGVELSLPIEKKEVCGQEVYFVDNNALVACFAKNGEVNEELCRELANYRYMDDLPITKVVFRDAGFANDNTKINVEQIFKEFSPSTIIKTL